MKTIYLTLLIAFSGFSMAHAQEANADTLNLAADTKAFHFPIFSASAKTINDFIPDGWHLKDKAVGQLNNDQLPDVAMVLEYDKKVKEKRAGGTNINHPRTLVVLFKTPQGYNFVLQQNTFILRDGEGWMTDDTYSAPEIKNRLLNIGFQYLREFDNYQFRYQNGDFYLVHMTGNSLNEYSDYNFLTHRYTDDKTPAEGTDEKPKSVRKTFHLSHPIKLKGLDEPSDWYELVSGI